MTSSTALVTGAASGIGRALAAALVADGVDRLVLLDVDAEGLAAVAQEAAAAEVRAEVADLTDAEALARVFADLTADGVQLDYLFNNAGIPAGTPAWPDTDPARIQAIIGVNLLGTILVTRLALPLMKRGGSILNTASTSGLRPYLTGAVYAASKAGVVMFTQSCRELADTHGVRVNAICPGIVRTPFLAKTGLGGAAADWLKDRLAATPLLEPEEVARAAIALARDPQAAGEYRTLEAGQDPN